MLAAGAVTGVVLWRVLMLEPPTAAGVRLGAPEQLSQHDRQALDRLLQAPAR
jgi:hypothetical protein